LLEAFVDLHLVELDFCLLDVLGTVMGDLGLVWQLQEGHIIDVEDKGVLLHVVVQ